MSLLVLADVILSNQVIAQGIKGRVIRKNQRITTANGFESVNIVWDRSLREYDFQLGPLRRDHWQELESIFEITDGGAYGFLLQDPKDFSAGTGGRVALVSGETDVYQLYKRYTEPVSGRYMDRKITRPKASTIQVLVSGDPVTATVDEATGRVTIASAPSAGLVTWTGQFYTPVHFQTDQIDWSMAAAGPDPDGRFMVGPAVTLAEIRE